MQFGGRIPIDRVNRVPGPRCSGYQLPARRDDRGHLQTSEAVGPKSNKVRYGTYGVDGQEVDLASGLRIMGLSEICRCSYRDPLLECWVFFGRVTALGMGPAAALALAGFPCLVRMSRLGSLPARLEKTWQGIYSTDMYGGTTGSPRPATTLTSTQCWLGSCECLLPRGICGAENPFRYEDPRTHHNNLSR